MAYAGFGVHPGPNPGVKWPGRKSDHSPPPSVLVKNTWSCTSTTLWMHGVALNQVHGEPARY